MAVARLGPYELLTCLAAGGMAEIYAARKTDAPDQILIIKRMLPQFSSNPTFVEMFLDEGRTVSLLAHPNIVRMLYFGFEGETPYLAMEYLHGVDVRTILRTTMHEDRKLPMELALAIMIDVCAGLHHAHEARSLDGRAMEIIHRDISPQNVFTTFDGEVKLIDFGIAKARGRSHETRAGALKGKVPYMAPEQIRNGAMDRRTDLYAAGVMLYELLTYRRPYIIDDGQEPQGEFSLMMAIVGHQIAPPRSVCPELPLRLEQLVLRALAARPADRFQTAAAMQRELELAAAELNLRAAPGQLARFLREGFGAHAQPWQQALRAGVHELVTRIESVGRLRAGSGSDEELDAAGAQVEEPVTVARTGAPPPARASASWDVQRPSSPDAVRPTPRRAQTPVPEGVSVLTLEPRIDESFAGAERAAELHGQVVLDLGAVQRISSYGVRQWLELQRALAERGDQVRLYLARCSEAVLGQLALVRAFAGRGQVVSFLAPYVCQACGHAFEHTFDCQRDAAVLAAPLPPPRPCPLCQAPALLDDDPSFLRPVQPFLGQPVPAAVRGVLDRLDATAAQGGAADKQVDGRRTRIRLLRPVDRGFRWSRLLDGVEGELELDVELLGDDGGALEALTGALRGLGPEVTAVTLHGAAPALVPALAAAPRCRVQSVAVRGRCGSCAAPRRATVSADEFADLIAGRAARAVCRRCAAPLTELELGRGSAAPLVAAPAGALAAAAVQVAASPVRARRARWPLLAALLLLAIAGGALLYAATATGAPARPTCPQGASC